MTSVVLGKSCPIRDMMKRTAYDDDFMLVFLDSAANVNIVPVKLNSDPSVPADGMGRC